MKTFEDLEFKEHGIVSSARESIKMGVDMTQYLSAKQAVIELDNGVKLSVLFGTVFYSNGVDTYEAMVLDEGDNEPRGYLTESQVTEYMKVLQR